MYHVRRFSASAKRDSRRGGAKLLFAYLQHIVHRDTRAVFHENEPLFSLQFPDAAANFETGTTALARICLKIYDSQHRCRQNWR